MIDVTNLRAGTTFQLDGVPYVVLKYTHTKIGRGGATVRIEARNLKTGSVETKTFNSGSRVEEASTVKRRMQYLYEDEAHIVFMDPTNFDQIEIPYAVVKDQSQFLKDGQLVDIMFLDETPLLIELPPKVTLTVVDTGPDVKGNSATNIWKPATLENGVQVKVPLFISIGDAVRVDTRTGEYVERVK